MKEQTLHYEVDKDGVIVSIKGPWDRFAKSNGGKSLAKSETIGRNLFEIVRGSGVVHVYRVMHEVLFANPARTIAFAYRCDAPDMRRFMKMEMKASGERIVYRSTIEKEEPVSPPLSLDYESLGEDFIVLCSLCKDFRYPRESSEWLPIERVLEKAPAVFAVSHSVCPSCFQKALGEAADIKVDHAL
ncbi:MAG TPA: hypothetical protein VFG28_03645 [Syntrophales bacterium]|nr:hypothetical protein [Syntrophales bacterium]